MSYGDKTMKRKLTVERLREVLDCSRALNEGAFVWRGYKGFKRTDLVGKRAGTDDGKGYTIIKVDQVIYPAHVLVWLHAKGEWPQHEIDHINGEHSDNRIENLRDVTRGVNAQNIRRPQSGKPSALPLGVSPSRGLFVAQIRIAGRQTNLGRFATPETAHAAYLAAKRAHHPGCTI